jgi:hypothetical protein
MHTAQRSLSRAEGDIALHELWIQSVTLKFVLTPTAREETAFVPFELEPNFENPRYFCFMKRHTELFRENTVASDIRKTEQIASEKRATNCSKSPISLMEIGSSEMRLDNCRGIFPYSPVIAVEPQ